jgi:DAACS family dicarboxylate/amino acid:cation (Na+ or H+) symporter
MTDEGSQHAPPIRRRMPLHIKILFGLLVGGLIGVALNLLYGGTLPGWVEWSLTNLAEPIGRIFLRLMLMIVVPLVFAALSLGVLELGDIRRLGRVGARTLLLALLLSGCSVVIGITLVNLIRPGESLDASQRQLLQERYQTRAAQTGEQAKAAKSIKDTLIDLIPENPLQEMVGALDGSSKGNGMLAVMTFALIFGAALGLVPQRTQALVQVLQGVFDVCMVIIGWAMRLAPLAVGCLVLAITARLGIDIVLTLLWFVVTVLLGLTFQLVVVYSALVGTLGGMSPWRFFSSVAEAMVTAFGTSSSNATLPTALRVAQDELKLPREVSQFVLTIGSTGNQNGTALYEGVVVLFLAQVFGVDLTFTQQVQVVLMSVLAGIGTAGVPGGSLPLIVVLLESVGVPGAGIAIILGIDRFLDMCRTVLNVTGDLCVAACIARLETSSATSATIAK